jgi:hypothetical protein
VSTYLCGRYGDIDPEAIAAEFQMRKKIKLAKENGEPIPEDLKPRTKKSSRKVRQDELPPDEEDLLERIKAQGKDCILLNS